MSQRSASPSTIEPRLRRSGPERKREILAAARAVFATRGYEQTSIAEIAAKVGVVEGAIYKHFANKRELLFEAMRTFYRPLIEQTREQLAGIHGTRNRLRFVIWRQFKGFVEEPGICRLIMHDIRPRQDYPESVVHELNRESTSLVLGIVEEAMARGEFRRDLPATMVRDVIYGGIEHVMWKALSGRALVDIDRLADDLTELIVSGVGARAVASDAAGAAAAGARSETGTKEHLETRVERLETMLEALAREQEADGEQ